MRNRSIGIDILKLVSMFYVVGVHLFGYLSPRFGFMITINTCFSSIFLGIFTFVSGYLISFKMGNLKTNLDLKIVMSFFKSKLVSNGVPFMIALLLFFYLDLVDINEFIESFLLVSLINGNPPQTIWFMIMIFNFYLITPLMYKYKDNLYIYIITSMLILICVLILHIKIGSDERLFLYLPTFLLGFYTKYNMENMSKKISLLVPFAIVAFILQSIHFDFKLLSLVTRGLSISIVSLTIFLLMNKIKIEKNNNFLRVISLLSITCTNAYFFHRVIFTIMINCWFPERRLYQFLYLFVIAVPILLLFSYYFQLLLNKMKKKWQCINKMQQ